MKMDIAAFCHQQYFCISKRQVIRVRAIDHTGRGAVLKRTDGCVSRWDPPL